MGFSHAKLYSRLRSGNITDLDPCFHSVKGAKHTEILTSIARIIDEDNAYRKSCGRKECGWTIPRKTRDNLYLLNGSFRSESSYLKGRSNYSRYIGNMRKQGVVRCFGLRDIGSFYIERCIFLWKCFNPDNVILFPGAIVDFIKSGRPLIDGMLLDGTSQGRNMSRKDLEKVFAEQVHQMTRKLPIDFRKELPDPMQGMAAEYVRRVGEVLVTADPLEGINRTKVSLDKLPRSIWCLGFGEDEKKFAELNPRDSNIVRGAMKKPFTRENIAIKKAGDIRILLDSELDVCNDPIHLIEYLVRVVKRVADIKYDTRIAADGVVELASTQGVMYMLVKDDEMIPQTVVSWATWYSRRPDAIVANKPLMKRFKATWKEFKKLKERPSPDNSHMNPQPFISDHIDRLIGIEGFYRGTTLSMMIYGPMITYAHILIELAKKDATDLMKTVVGGYDNLPADRREARCRKIAEAIGRYGTYAGSMVDKSIITKVNSLLNSVGMDIDTVDTAVPLSAPAGTYEFWNIMESRV